MMDNVKSLHGDTPEDELTSEQLFERLQGAKLVAENQRSQIAEREQVIEAQKLLIKAQRNEIDIHREVALEIVSILAFNGNGTHKEKNEAILTVIARLMALRNNYAPRSKTPDYDDIPF